MGKSYISGKKKKQVSKQKAEFESQISIWMIISFYK